MIRISKFLPGIVLPGKNKQRKKYIKISKIRAFSPLKPCSQHLNTANSHLYQKEAIEMARKVLKAEETTAVPDKAAVAEPKTTAMEVAEISESAKTALSGHNSSFQPDEVKQYQELCNKIQAEIGSVESAYLTIAMELYTIREKQLYQIDNYPNVYDMAYDKFSLSRATCNNYINICKNFGKIDEVKKECSGLLPEYEKFSSSKLVAMLNIPDELRKEITPDMSVREIKRKRQIYEERKLLSDNPSDNSEDLPKKSGGKKVIELLKTDNIAELIEKDNNILLEKYDSIMREYPDAKYTISITLLPKK